MGVHARVKIGIQGEPGSYSAEAAARLLPGSEAVSFTTFEDVHQRLRDKSIDAALLPFENSLIGSLSEQYDLLVRYPAEIEQEFILHVQHQLIGLSDGELGMVQEVFSHPAALLQCRRFFVRHPHIRQTPFYDTAGSVAHVLGQGDYTLAAIASRQAAARYGGRILKEDVHDDADNCTRFLMLRRPGEVQPSSLEASKVSVLLEVAHQPAALSAALADFAEHGYNLTKIEPRTIPGSSLPHSFFADFECASPAEADDAIATLQARGGVVRVLGRYRAARRPNGNCLR
jgi:prephenate dehydratase